MGLKPSSDEFQDALNIALKGLHNIHIIADDILVVGENIELTRLKDEQIIERTIKPTGYLVS